MKKLLTIALCLLTASAFAQNSTCTTGINEAGFGCSMKSGSNWSGGISVSAQGLWSSHWCKGTDARWHLRVNAVSALNAASMASDWMKIQSLEPAAYSTAFDALMTKYPAAKLSIYDPSLTSIWQGNCATILASKPADVVVEQPPQVAQGWFVAPNGSAATRQWFQCDNCATQGNPLAVRAAKSGGSTSIKDSKGNRIACKPEIAWKRELTDTTEANYMSYGPTYYVNRVTLCTLQPL
jgi:hypothetical protein